MKLHRIEIPTSFPVGPVNAYLLAEDPLTLVDTGPKSPECQAALDAGVAAAGHRLDEIRRIIITHGHTDHFGNAAWVQQRSGAEVFAHDADGHKLAGERWYVDQLKTFFTEAGLPESFLQDFTQMLQGYRRFFDPLPAFTRLRDGDTVPLGGQRLRVLHCPGHSQGHICLYHDDGILIAGDLLLEEVSPNPIVEFAPDGRRVPTLPQYLHSLRRVLLLTCDVAYPGHGAPITNPGARIRELIAHHEQRKESIRERVGTTPKTLLALVHELYPNLDQINVMLGLSEVIGHLDLLVEEKRVTVSRRRGQMFYRGK